MKALKPALAGILGLGLVLAISPMVSQAQDYPSKPIRLLISFTPGGAPILCRGSWAPSWQRLSSGKS